MGLNLAECIALSAQTYPDRDAVVLDGLRLSYAALDAGARRVASLLRARGIGPGDRVALMLPNVPHFPIIYYGILYAGATVVSVNVMLRRREILHQLDDAGVQLVFVFEDFLGEAAAAAAMAARPPQTVAVESGMTPAAPEGGHSFLALWNAADDAFDPVQTRPDDTAVILYTAAMGGAPLGAELTHFNLFQNAQTIREYVIKFHPEDVFLCVLPLFHAFGQTTMMNAPLLAGSCIVMMPRFDPARVLEAIARERVSLMAVVPTMLNVLLAYKPHEPFDLSAMRSVISGGAPMNLDTAAAFSKRFNVCVLEGYGLTETGPVVSFNRDAETNRPGSIGPPLWGVQAAIERSDGTHAPAGETGEIVLRGHGVMKGYLGAPAQNAESFRGGWFHTGDLGHLDADGYLYITGLKKDLIIRTGLNVYPRELELVLEAHPAVAEAAVVGIPDPLRGEEVRAYVVLEPGHDRAAALHDLGAYCRHELAVYKVPKRIEAVGALPRLPGGALDKAALKRRG